ncbi:hypothetical protein SEA_BBQVALINDRA_52 [Gordonia phage BBQValindra]|nr:hypothetical protein SEA_BBQVALINDRA_52 [Gordonia phage BBQValindra]
MSTEHVSTVRTPRPGEPWIIRTRSGYQATGILRMAGDDDYEWVIVASDARSQIGGRELPDGWKLVTPLDLPLPPLSTQRRGGWRRGADDLERRLCRALTDHRAENSDYAVLPAPEVAAYLAGWLIENEAVDPL